MELIRQHLLLPNPRFVCRDISGEHSLTVCLASDVGPPATEAELDQLRAIAGSEYDTLHPFYSDANGAEFHVHRGIPALVIVPVHELQLLNQEWRLWFEELNPDELYAFQAEGIAFGTVPQSANYFVAHRGKIYYSDHDGGDDAVWGDSLEDFLRRVLTNPARFYDAAGCFTRYSDGETDRDYFPEAFVHD